MVYEVSGLVLSCFYKSGSFKRGSELLYKGLGLIESTLRAEPYKNHSGLFPYMGVVFLGVLTIRALLVGGFIVGPLNFWELWVREMAVQQGPQELPILWSHIPKIAIVSYNPDLPQKGGGGASES